MGDAAYHKHARGGLSHDIGKMHKKLVKIARVVLEIFTWTDAQTDRHTHHNTLQLHPRAK